MVTVEAVVAGSEKGQLHRLQSTACGALLNVRRVMEQSNDAPILNGNIGHTTAVEESSIGSHPLKSVQRV